MSADRTGVGQDARIRAERGAFYESQRARVGRTDAAAIVGVVLFVLFSIGDSVILYVWAAVVWTQVVSGIAIYRAASIETQPFWLKAAEVWWFRGTSVSWALLPLLLLDRAQDVEVAWVIAFFIIFGLASDAIYLPQTYDINLVASGSGFALPALGVLAYSGQWIPFAAILGILLHVTVAASGITRIVNELLEKSVRASDAEDEARRQSLTDPLTGLFNRAGVLAALEELRDDPEVDMISVCFIDLDGFKAINDNYSYACGDHMLIQFGEAIVDVVPDGWSVGRFGGDEFVAAGRGDDGPQVAEAIAKIVKSPIAAPGARAVRASVGVNVVRTSEADSLTMLHFAGTAVRAAKTTPGQSVMHSTEELQSASARRAQLEAALPDAIANGEIEGIGQAQVDISTGDLCGIELLARWNRDDEVVMPGEFIPLVGKIGLDHEFDLSMIRNAFEVLAQTKHLDVQVSVNVSTKRFASPVFVDHLAELLDTVDIDTTRLTLEVTETDELTFDDETVVVVQRLAALGPRLSIDDFGTGYSSLTRLVAMPFSELKLDLSLIQRLGEPGVDDLVRSISDFAQRNNIAVVAEGVETEQQRSVVADLGIRNVQGYLFGMPAPIDELLWQFESSYHQAA